MASLKLTICALFVIFAAMTYEADAIKCYGCNDCTEFEGKSVDCDAATKPEENGEKGATHCYIKIGYEDKVKRGCTKDKDLCKTADLPETSCSVCEGEDCNAASSIATSLLLTAAGVIALKYFN